MIFFCRDKILQSAVCAGADNNLVDFDIVDFLNKVSIFRKVRKRNGRFDFRQVDNIGLVIDRIVVRLEDLRLAAAVSFLHTR